MNIYISLTTVPLRMAFWESSEKNLKSLLNQNTTLDYKVILNVPYFYKNNNNEEYQISDDLKKLSNENEKLIINRVEKDFGPIVKLTGVLPISTNDDDVLIICDDDHLYHEDMLEYHLKKQHEHPNSVIAFRGDNPVEIREWIEDGIKKYTVKPTHFYFPVKKDSQLAVPGHWHSVSYRRGFFEDDFLNEEYHLASQNDDIAIGHYMKRKQIPIVCATWDKETDFRPVNDHGRSSFSFPIVQSLPFIESGFYEFRVKCGDGYGITKPEVAQFMGDHEIIYTEKKKTDKIIVTLTTLPSRIIQDYDSGIKSNINSLLTQEYNGEYEIHFNVPKTLKYKNEEYIIPEWIKELASSNPKFKLFDGLEDLGPITKLAHTLRRVTDPEAIIIVCDDDLVYHPKMIEEQVKNQHKYENTSVGYDGSRAEDPTVFNDVRNHYVVSIYKDVEVNILQHYKTVSYKRKWFQEDFFTEFLGKSWNDDILVAAYMGKHKIKKLVTYYENEEKLITIEQWTEKGGVTTFPVLRHTSHEGEEGCFFYRRDKLDENYGEYLKLGYLK